jgi:hypothetical protein
MDNSEKIELIKKEIDKHKENMYYSSMSDDRYYSNGKHREDIAWLTKLDARLKELEKNND